MGYVYISPLEGDFANALADMFSARGFEVVSEPVSGIEYFIDLTDEYLPNDDKRVGEGVDIAAAELSYRKNICAPIAALEKALPDMTGKKRVCFINDAKSSVNYSTETVNYGHNMSKAALNTILLIAKNTLAGQGYTFRLFDPMIGRVDACTAAKSAFAYFTRDRFIDTPADALGRNDELLLVVRDALNREIPW